MSTHIRMVKGAEGIPLYRELLYILVKLFVFSLRFSFIHISWLLFSLTMLSAFFTCIRSWMPCLNCIFATVCPPLILEIVLYLIFFYFLRHSLMYLFLLVIVLAYLCNFMSFCMPEFTVIWSYMSYFTLMSPGRP